MSFVVQKMYALSSLEVVKLIQIRKAVLSAHSVIITYLRDGTVNFFLYCWSNCNKNLWKLVKLKNNLGNCCVLLFS